jgi:hypothetical protein
VNRAAIFASSAAVTSFSAKEVGHMVSRPVDQPERRVPRARQLRRRLHDPLRERVDRKLRAERDARIDEHPEAVELTRRGVHASICSAAAALVRTPT